LGLGFGFRVRDRDSIWARVRAKFTVKVRDTVRVRPYRCIPFNRKAGRSKPRDSCDCAMHVFITFTNSGLCFFKVE
jgi:hypothetical protein